MISPTSLQALEKLKSLFLSELPGETVQMEMAPFIRKPLQHYLELPNFNPKNSAVCVVVYPTSDNDLEIIAIQRAGYDGHHSSQIAFPGGKKDETDESLYHTAVRELKEELGIDAQMLHFIGALSNLYIPVSNFMVYPFFFYSSQKPTIISSPREVENVLYLSVRNELLNNALKSKQRVKLTAGIVGEVPCYTFQNQIVWGATAMILRELEFLLNKYNS